MKKHLKPAERAEIVARRIAGEHPADIAERFGIHERTVYRVFDSDPDFANKCQEIKKEAEEKAQIDMVEWIRSRQRRGQYIADNVLASLSQEDMTAVSVRDRAGLLKILVDVFHSDQHEDKTEGMPISIRIVEQDQSGGSESDG